MEKKFASNIKISHALLATIFSILFIFTAIANPLIAHAEEDSGATITQIPNINSRDANVDDVSTDQQAGYLYYAASGTRCGAMWYVVNTAGVIQASGILLDRSGIADYDDYANYGEFRNWVTTAYAIPRNYATYNYDELVSRAKYEDNVSTVYYSGGWKAKGIDVLSYLMEDTGYNLEICGVSTERCLFFCSFLGRNTLYKF